MPAQHDVGGTDHVKYRLLYLVCSASCSLASLNLGKSRKRSEMRRSMALSGHWLKASSVQPITVARLPGRLISESATNAALAFVEGCRPINEMDAALAIQMACTHGASGT